MSDHDDHEDGAREVPSTAPALPPSLAKRLGGAEWHRNLVGEAGATVHRLHRQGAPDLYLKHADADSDAALAITDEFARLQWLSGRWPVPAIEHFEAASRDPSEQEASAGSGKTWLLTRALPGHTAYEWLSDQPEHAPEIVAAIGRCLRQLHELPASTCPFNARHELQLDLARQRLDADLIDADDFDDERDGWTPQQVWEALNALLPLAEDLVVSHGDFSLDNILMSAEGEVIGAIDLGRVGIADRYRDLAILANCLDEFDPALRQTFFGAYGIGAPDAPVGLKALDERKLAFHLLLDECF